MSTATTEKPTTVRNDGNHDKYAHYAPKADIDRAILDGVEITALCGKQWRPDVAVAGHSVCPACRTAWEALP